VGNGDEVAIRMRCADGVRAAASRKENAGSGAVGIAGCGAGDDVQQGRAVAHRAGQRVAVHQAFESMAAVRGEGGSSPAWFEADDSAA